MITVHRLSLKPEPFALNPDLIFTIESHPDTVITLTNGTKLLVCESPTEVADQIRKWRSSILAQSFVDSGLGRATQQRVERHGMTLVSSPPLQNTEETGSMADHRKRFKP